MPKVVRTASGWRNVPLSDICEGFISGGTPSTAVKEFWAGDIPWITSADIRELKVQTVRNFITRNAVEGSATSIVTAGNLLVVTRVGVGKIAIAPFDVAISQDTTGVVPDKKIVLSEFLLYALYFRMNSLARYNQGTSINGVTRKELVKLEVPLPPLIEQRKIAAILSTWDKAIDLLGKWIAAKQRLKRALMQRLLAGKLRFSGFGPPAKGRELPEGWRLMKLSEVLLEVDRPNRDLETDLVLSCSKVYGIIAQGERFEKRIASSDLSRYKIVQQRDLVYDPMLLWDASIGFVENYALGVVSPAYNTYQFIGDELQFRYLRHLLYSWELKQRYKAISQGTNWRRRKAPSADFLNIDIRMPSEIKELQNVVSVLDSVDKEIKMLEKYKFNLVHQKRGLMQKLLTGEMRVRT